MSVPPEKTLSYLDKTIRALDPRNATIKKKKKKEKNALSRIVFEQQLESIAE